MSEKNLILGIETSCDETAASVVRSDKTILSNVVFSQLEEHQPYGGVVPEIAARAHLDKLDAVVEQALKDANVTFEQLSAIAVTAGPGLIGGVIVGVMAAKAYASVYKKPLYAINHLEGHALTVRLTDTVEFPYLLVLVSGGHCQILQVEGVGRYRLLGATKDDALGEAFDKTAKMMGLPYPGGPQIEQLAKKGDAQRFNFPKPLFGLPGCDFSFSGLKTAVRLQLLDLMKSGALKEQDKCDIAASFQRTITEILVDRIGNALELATHHSPLTTTLVLSGGVAANQAIRGTLTKLAENNGFRFIAPPINLCTDNAAMIAWAGCEKLLANMPADNLTFEPKARWHLAA